MSMTKLNIGACLFISFFSLFWLDAGAREWEIMIYLAPISAMLGAWLAYHQLLRRDVALGLFGLIQCLYWPFAFLILTLLAPGVARQAALATLAAINILASALCLLRAYKHFSRRSRDVSSTLI